MNNMEITDITIYPVSKTGNNSRLKAFAKIILNDQFVIHGVRIYSGTNGGFMVFPQDYNVKHNEGRPYSICHPTTAELRGKIDKKVMEEYAKIAGLTSKSIADQVLDPLSSELDRGQRDD